MPDAKVEEVDRERAKHWILLANDVHDSCELAHFFAAHRTTAEAKGAADATRRIVARLRERETFAIEQAKANLGTRVTTLYAHDASHLKKLADEIERGE